MANPEIQTETTAEAIREDLKKAGTVEERTIRLRGWVMRAEGVQDTKKRRDLLDETHKLLGLLEDFVAAEEHHIDPNDKERDAKLKLAQNRKDQLKTLNEDILRGLRKAEGYTPYRAAIETREGVAYFKRQDPQTQILVAGGTFAALSALFYKGKRKFRAMMLSIAGGIGLTALWQSMRHGEKPKTEQPAATPGKPEGTQNTKPTETNPAVVDPNNKMVPPKKVPNTDTLPPAQVPGSDTLPPTQAPGSDTLPPSVPYKKRL